MYKLYRHRLYREQIVSSQIVSSQFVSAQFVSDTNCIGHKLYRAQIVTGTNCIGHKLYLVTIFIQCSGSGSIYHSYQHMVLCVCVPRCLGDIGTKISVGENADYWLVSLPNKDEPCPVYLLSGWRRRRREELPSSSLYPPAQLLAAKNNRRVCVLKEGNFCF